MRIAGLPRLDYFNTFSVSRMISLDESQVIRKEEMCESRLNAASSDPLNPLAPPGRRLEGIPEILSLVHDVTVAELHNAHCVCWSPLVGDCVFRDPEVTLSEIRSTLKPDSLP